MKKFLLTITLAAMSLCSFAQGYELSIEGMGSVGPVRCSNSYAGINILNGYRIPWGTGLFVGVGSGIVATSYLTDVKKVEYIDAPTDFEITREKGNFFVPVYGSLQYYLTKGKMKQLYARLDVGYEFAAFRYDFGRKLFDKSGQEHGMYVEPSIGYNIRLKGMDKSRSVYVTLGPTFQRCVFNRTVVKELSEINEDGYIGTATTKKHNWLLPSIALRVGWRL